MKKGSDFNSVDNNLRGGGFSRSLGTLPSDQTTSIPSDPDLHEDLFLTTKRITKKILKLKQCECSEGDFKYYKQRNLDC